MTPRNETLIHVSAALVILALCGALYQVFTDSRPGLSVMSATLQDRVSYHYLLKTARTPDEAASRSVVLGEDGYENGAANIVTAVVTDYRALDTLGEVMVLLASTSGVSLLMRTRKRKIEKEASSIVTTAIPFVMLFAVVTGLYIVVHGHLTPGGGFPGGAVIASAFILRSLAFKGGTGRKLFPVLESFAGLGILAMALAGLFLEGSFFANFLPTGEVGAIFSALGIMIVYALIGIKVASELSSMSGYFIGDAE